MTSLEYEANQEHHQQEQGSVGVGSSSWGLRTALALNNISVSLMEQGKYRQAVKTLRDSLELLNLAFGHSPVPQEQQDGTSGVNVSHCASPREHHHQQLYKVSIKTLHEAQQALALSQFNGSSLMPNSQAPSSCNMPDCHSLEDEDCAQIRATIDLGPTMTAVFPLRIRDSQCCNVMTTSLNQNEDRINVETKFGIILYNHGLAHLLLYLHEQHSGRNSSDNNCGPEYRPLTLATRSFALANTSHLRCIWYHRQHQNSHDQHGHRDSAMPSILLAALALFCLAQAHEMQNQIPQAAEVVLVILDLFSMLERDRFAAFFSPMEDRIVAPAA